MITSVGNRTIRSVRRLGKRPWRERRGSLLCEGHRTLAGALDGGARVEQVFHTNRAKRLRADLLARAKKTGAEIFAVSPAIMGYLTEIQSPPDVLAVVALRETTLERQRSEGGVILLSAVRDPATAGGIMATARAAGASGVIAASGSADIFDRKTIRAAQGAHFHLDVVRDVTEKEAIEHHRGEGARVVAMSSDGPRPWDVPLTGRVLFVIEGEGADAHGEVAALADTRVGLPEGASVAARAAMLLTEWMRQAER